MTIGDFAYSTTESYKNSKQLDSNKISLGKQYSMGIEVMMIFAVKPQAYIPRLNWTHYCSLVTFSIKNWFQ